MDRNGVGHICRQIWLSSHMDHWLRRKFVLHICTPGVATYQTSFRLVFSCNNEFLSQHFPLNLIWISPTSFAVMVNRKKSLKQWISNQWILSQMRFSKGLKIYFLSQWHVREERKKKSSPKTLAADVILRLYARLTRVSSKILNLLCHISFSTLSHFLFNFITFCFQLHPHVWIMNVLPWVWTEYKQRLQRVLQRYLRAPQFLPS